KTGKSLEYDFIQNSTIQTVLDSPIVLKPATQADETDVIWPSLDHYEDDRIVKQMKFKSKSVLKLEKLGKKIPVKNILLYNGYNDWGVKPGRTSFVEQKCPVSACALTDRRVHGRNADAVLFRQEPRVPWTRRPPNQRWILFLLEAPYFTPNLDRFRGLFNWVSSYRRDSDIAAPYEKFVKYNPPRHTLNSTRNYAAGKTKKVAWFVSNCEAANSRLEYAKELSRHIQVDIYGKCGTHKCPRGKDACLQMLKKDYKFYLSFENSNCRDYITEKFFFTGLQHDVIPIVMGAAPEDYRRAAPHYSFIHVDEYPNPRALADYLHQLDANDNAYNEYFRWKGTGEFVNTYFWCRLCAMLHDDTRQMTTYDDVNKWWRGKDVHDVIPIVMGAAPEDYRRAAPHYSFIHVEEYPSARALADYLHQLDANDNAYNEYFRWKGTGEFVNTYFWCRLCAMLYDDTRQMTTYDDVNKWWRGKDVCIGKDRWGEHADRGRYISDFYT
ncbi:FUCTA-like protein, partial [Mya arenaria]